MGTFHLLTSGEIEKSLLGVRRQYLAGDLARPQNLEHIPDGHIDMGISNYVDYTVEPLHIHSEVREYQLMLSGYTEYYNPETGETFVFRKGDFYVIDPHTPYIQKAKKGTRIFFIKSSTVNDKTELEPDGKTLHWVELGIRPFRKDHFHDAAAPKPNSIVPATAVAIIEEGKLLLVHRKDNDKWAMPGGTIEFGESIQQCAIRELKEETGYDIELTGIVDVYSDPGILVEYADSEVRQEYTTVFSGNVVGGSMECDDESYEAKWVPLEEVVTYPMAESQLIRIKDVLKKNGL